MSLALWDVSFLSGGARTSCLLCPFFAGVAAGLGTDDDDADAEWSGISDVFCQVAFRHCLCFDFTWKLNGNRGVTVRSLVWRLLALRLSGSFGFVGCFRLAGDFYFHIFSEGFRDLFFGDFWVFFSGWWSISGRLGRCGALSLEAGNETIHMSRIGKPFGYIINILLTGPQYYLIFIFRYASASTIDDVPCEAWRLSQTYSLSSTQTRREEASESSSNQSKTTRQEIGWKVQAFWSEHIDSP